jgi:hypothetical protein
MLNSTSSGSGTAGEIVIVAVTSSEQSTSVTVTEMEAGQFARAVGAKPTSNPPARMIQAPTPPMILLCTGFSI